MFTGIIQASGRISRLQRRGNAMRITLQTPQEFTGMKVGESLAVNGICLTATNLADGEFTADVMPETYEKTTLGKLDVGAVVNLERALPVTGRFDGHLVTGHVDGTGRVTANHRVENAQIVTISLPPQLRNQLVTKGAITVDGASLTVIEARPTQFSIGLIPETQARTTLANVRVGQLVNLEIDLVFRYLAHLGRNQQNEINQY
ncbi:riboflavin synthase [Levilactobacillus bambusae]|uniref:Riboflavin synthase n=1 Tax=Levilactobacillus bambusae TaxID=2024736 RepID=A0A2V1N0R7_9LACO|nr:riboflavin synthase [Levilactobacillus bambusae]PWG00338.1 riboflavin synthase [Levilactobacillus bambusae]